MPEKSRFLTMRSAGSIWELKNGELRYTIDLNSLCNRVVHVTIAAMDLQTVGSKDQHAQRNV